MLASSWSETQMLASPDELMVTWPDWLNTSDAWYFPELNILISCRPAWPPLMAISPELLICTFSITACIPSTVISPELLRLMVIISPVIFGARILPELLLERDRRFFTVR